MSFFKNNTTILLCLLIIKASCYNILKKYDRVENSDGTVIFESKEFSEGEKMYFRVTVKGECKSDLKYKYYSNSVGIT